MPTHVGPHGFTLVELLVVITIVVVLLSLLMPALDRAVYEAELAVCAARIEATGQAAITYAIGNRRYYPHRPYAQATSIDRLNTDRPVLRRCLPINKLLVCPLAPNKDIDLDGAKSGIVFSSYALWFGFNYAREARGMRRVGDRLEFDTWRLNLLASDVDMKAQGQGRWWASHQDSDGRLQAAASQEDEYFMNQGVKDPNSGLPDAAGVYTFSIWLGPNGIPVQAGMLDLNYGYQDGSVTRSDNVEWLDPERMIQASWYANHTYGRLVQVPKAGAQ